MNGKPRGNHGPARVVKIKLPAQVDAPLPVFTDRVIIFVPESIGRNSKVVIFPADSLRVRVHAKQIERKPVSAVAVEPKDTVEIVLEPQTAWKWLFETYHLACPAVGNNLSIDYISTLIVVVEVVGEPLRAVIQYILPVVQCTVPSLPKPENLWELAFLVRKEHYQRVGEVTDEHTKEL